MSENDGQEYLPKKLTQYLVYLWIALINVGVDFGLLLKATRSIGMVVLYVLLVISVLFSIYWTRELVSLFREQCTDDTVRGHPEII